MGFCSSQQMDQPAHCANFVQGGETFITHYALCRWNTDTCTHTHACMHACIHAHMCTHAHTCTHARTYARTYAFSQNKHAWVCAHMLAKLGQIVDSCGWRWCEQCFQHRVPTCPHQPNCHCRCCGCRSSPKVRGCRRRA